MQITTHKQYDKMWVRLSDSQKRHAKAAIKLFITHPDHPKLRRHQLKGSYFPQYSISAGGDLRIHYLLVSKESVVLVLIGTHSKLYG